MPSNIILPASVVSQVKSLRPAVGMEIWQILTGITIVLSIASSLMWFSNIQPRSTLLEFVWLDQAKTKMYSQFDKLRNDNLNLIQNQIVKGTINQKCYQDVQSIELNLDPYNQINSSSLEAQQTLEEIKTLAPDKLNSMRYDSDFDNFITSYDTYRSDVSKFYDNQIRFYKSTLDVQKQASLVCSSNSENLDKNLELLKNKIDVIKKSNSPRYTSWIESVDKFYTNSKSFFSNIKSYNDDTNKLEQLKTSLKSSFLQIYGIKFGIKSESEVFQKSEKNFVESVNRLETWQQNKSKSSSVLQSRYVVIDQNKK